MNKKLVYKITYTPNKKCDKDINYLCSDDKIHIRLKRFGYEREIISGFEKKLTFLITYTINSICSKYLMSKDILNYSKNKENYNNIWNFILKKFKQSDENFYLVSLLNDRIFKFGGLKILPMYSKKIKKTSALDLFGECPKLQVEINNTFENIPNKDNLITEFIKYFKLSSLEDFLFNDAYEIQIDYDTKINNSKFINKSKNKLTKFKAKLW